MTYLFVDSIFWYSTIILAYLERGSELLASRFQFVVVGGWGSLFLQLKYGLVFWFDGW